MLWPTDSSGAGGPTKSQSECSKSDLSEGRLSRAGTNIGDSLVSALRSLGRRAESGVTKGSGSHGAGHEQSAVAEVNELTKLGGRQIEHLRVSPARLEMRGPWPRLSKLLDLQDELPKGGLSKSKLT